jgi:nucleoside-diphosphate-sugar epimerase
MMKKVLVCGAAGFVGGELVKQLREKGVEVVGLGRSKPPEQMQFIRADLTNAAALDNAFNDYSFDTIMHLASRPGDTGNPKEMIQVNVSGLQNILEVTRRLKVQRFVLASSISAYEWYPATKFNPPDYLPVDEDHPCRPKDMYSTSKHMQELLALTYFHQYDVPVVILRLTAVVGPAGRGGGRGWYEFAEQLAEGNKVQIPHFSADELCHYVDIRDAARMFIAAAEHQNAIGNIFNCCGPSPTRGLEFVKAIEEIVPGIKVELGYPWSMAQGQELCFSMRKAKELIGYETKYGIDDSIRNIKNWLDAGGLEKMKSIDKGRYGSGIQQG